VTRSARGGTEPRSVGVVWGKSAFHLFIVAEEAAGCKNRRSTPDPISCYSIHGMDARPHFTKSVPQTLQVVAEVKRLAREARLVTTTCKQTG